MMTKSAAIVSILFLFSLVTMNQNHAYAEMAALADGAGQAFRYPLATECKLARGFGAYVQDGQFEGKYHTAQDCSEDGGTPVYAVAEGIIAFSGTLNGYGWLIIVNHPATNVYSLYGHMSTRRWKKLSGTVQYGELIGYLGDDDEDGGSWKPHLHFSIRTGQKADYPSYGDDRWMAGYTFAYPTDYGWVDPLDFIEDHQDLYQGVPPAPPAGFQVISTK